MIRKTLTVGQLMQDALFTCTPRTDALTIGRLMTKQNFGGLPVVGDNGILVGLVTEYDLLQAMIEGGFAQSARVGNHDDANR